MAIVTASILFGLPEDKESDVIIILESSSENGTFSSVHSETYRYGIRAIEYASLDTTKWYKIQFRNSVTSVSSPLSVAVFGGNYDNTKPFVAISTSFDGNSYATPTDVFDSSNLTPTDVSTSKIRAALKTARAYIDIILGETNLYKYSRAYTTDVSRRKYNAQLEILKKIEVGFALALVYKDMADDQIMKSVREQKKTFDSISIGQTSISLDSTKNYLQIAEFLDTQGQRYNSQAAVLLSTILPTSVPLMYNEIARSKPTDIFDYRVCSSSSNEDDDGGDTLELQTEILTGNGTSMNNAWYNLSSTLLTTSAIIEDTVLIVNGVQYTLNSWIDTNGVTHGSGTTGFSLDVRVGTHKIRFNDVAANGGFDLSNTDEILLKYWS